MLQPVMTPAVKFALSYPKQRISLFALFLFIMYFPDLPPCHSQVVPPGSKLSSNAQILDASTRTLSRAPPFKEIDYHQRRQTLPKRRHHLSRRTPRCKTRRAFCFSSRMYSHSSCRHRWLPFRPACKAEPSLPPSDEADHSALFLCFSPRQSPG